ncbi:MAG: MFS transporter [Bacteroidales bacterium]|nr:MFS transporter [Bacteroidales bacterium]
MALYNDFRSFPRTFWVANTMELFERWAYYGMFTVLSVYLTDPVSEGGLGFTQQQRGAMQGIVTAILYFLPILGGALADRFGFRKVLLAAFVTLASGYFAMGQFHAYAPVFIAFLVVAVGGALFKPIIVGTVSKTAAKGTETLGFGIFYMIVNIGGFLGPWAASKMRDISWQYVFIMCSVVILINLVLLMFYREPGRKEKEKETFVETIANIFSNSITVLSNWRFDLFLVIMVGFWITYMQLFFTVPVYITQWIDTTVIYNHLGFLKPVFGAVDEGVGIVHPEMIINIPAFSIILFQVLMSNALKNVKPVKSMVGGTIVLIIGMGQFYFHVNGIYFAISLVIFAFGEMASSPRIQEYISSIAPKEKVGVYMGYSFLPVAFGNLFGGFLSGSLYGSMSDKFNFLKDYLVENRISTRPALDAIEDNGDLFLMAQEKLGMSARELTQLLYQTYHPGGIWLVFAGIGLGTAVLLFLYNKFILDGSKG